MSDIGLSLVNNCFDIDLLNGDIKSDDGLETAVIISIFTDRRVTDDDLPDLEESKMGWWGDMFSDIANDQIGSRLWLLKREKTTTETLRRSEDYIREALNWMLEDGVATNIEVNSAYNEFKHLIATIDILRPNDDETRFQVLWDNQEIRRA